MSIDRNATQIPDEKACVIRVLDVGCGTGDSLREELDLRLGERGNASQIEMVGIDIDETALAQGRTNYPQFLFICAKGEKLPFPDGSFDAVISRVAMPYMDIPVALREIRRVLKVGGELKIKLHPLSFTFSELTAELRSGSARNRAQNLIYRLYVIANGMALHFLGLNFRFPLARRRCESFQTQNGTRRALVAAGFVQIDVSCWTTKIKWPHCGDCRASARRSA
jgi:SAM-dependent methyltransferase